MENSQLIYDSKRDGYWMIKFNAIWFVAMHQGCFKRTYKLQYFPEDNRAVDMLMALDRCHMRLLIGGQRASYRRDLETHRRIVVHHEPCAAASGDLFGLGLRLLYVPNARCGLAFDKKRKHVIVANTGAILYLTFPKGSHRPRVVRVITHIFDPEITIPHRLTGIKSFTLDAERDRLIVVERFKTRLLVAPYGHPHSLLKQEVHVLSAVDGSFLFELDTCDIPPRENADTERRSGFDRRLLNELSPAPCVDNHGRIILADILGHRLIAFDEAGQLLSTFQCSAKPSSVAFDKRRGQFAYTSADEMAIHVVAANEWLPDTYVWTPRTHRWASRELARRVLAVTQIRSLEPASPLALMPNELLFEIFMYMC